jgi:hypothetical protein
MTGWGHVIMFSIGTHDVFVCRQWRSVRTYFSMFTGQVHDSVCRRQGRSVFICEY